MRKKVEITPLNSSFKFAKDANNYLQLADAFLEAHPYIIYWTEKNSTKKGLFYKYHEGLWSAISSLEVEQMLINFKPTDAHIVMPSMLSQAKHMETMNNIMRRRFFYRDDFNPEGIVNLKNGYYDLIEGKLLPHSMTIISTNQLPYSYDEKAECPNFLKVLNDATENDPAKFAVIQEFAGYCLTRDTRLEKMLFLIGSAGSGKSSVLDGIEAMLGEDNVSSATMDKICQPRYSGLFIDKIANISTEIPKDVQGFEEALKAVVSGEKITVDTKFVPSYDARPFCKLIFAGNDLPHISDTSDAIFRRMLLIYFNNSILEENMDVGLKIKIRKEGAGIFNWALEGLKRLKENGRFTITQDMRRDIEAVKVQNNSVYYFITENYDIELDDSNFVPYDTLYEHYKEFCFKVGSKGAFKLVMLNKEIRKIFNKKIKSGHMWHEGTTKSVWFGLRRKGLRADAPITGWQE